MSVPPQAYGGTELVIWELSRMLTRVGHDVTVFATGDSKPAGRLRWHFRHAVWPPDETANLRHSAHAWRTICDEEPRFDVVHAHQAPAISFSSVCATPTVLTLHHDRNEKLVEYYGDFPEVTYVAISQRQAELVPEIDVRHVIHHGLSADAYPAGDGLGGGLAFVGRFAPEKGPHVAIDAALAAGLPLEMGGKPHWANATFFEEEVKPRMARAGDRIVWHGEVAFAPKLAILRRARATLFPIQWEEPFGLVMIESMLVGTPVVAFRRGAAPEVIDDGITGFAVRDFGEMVDAIRRVGSIDRIRCRQRARERWSSARMARDYEQVYEEAARARRDSFAGPLRQRRLGRG